MRIELVLAVHPADEGAAVGIRQAKVRRGGGGGGVTPSAAPGPVLEAGATHQAKGEGGEPAPRRPGVPAIRRPGERGGIEHVGVPLLRGRGIAPGPGPGPGPGLGRGGGGGAARAASQAVRAREGGKGQPGERLHRWHGGPSVAMTSEFKTVVLCVGGR